MLTLTRFSSTLIREFKEFPQKPCSCTLVVTQFVVMNEIWIENNTISMKADGQFIFVSL
jgi:hypothetical protein